MAGAAACDGSATATGRACGLRPAADARGPWSLCTISLAFFAAGLWTFSCTSYTGRCRDARYSSGVIHPPQPLQDPSRAEPPHPGVQGSHELPRGRRPSRRRQTPPRPSREQEQLDFLLGVHVNLQPGYRRGVQLSSAVPGSKRLPRKLTPEECICRHGGNVAARVNSRGPARRPIPWARLGIRSLGLAIRWARRI